MYSFMVCTASALMGCYADLFPYATQAECLEAGFEYRRQHPQYLHVTCDWVGVTDFSDALPLIVIPGDSVPLNDSQDQH